MSTTVLPDPLPTPLPHPSGGWGSVNELGTALLREQVVCKGGSLLPECNPLIPFWHCAKDSMVAAAKSMAVVLWPMAQGEAGHG